MGADLISYRRFDFVLSILALCIAGRLRLL
jgi:hypothetical protein